VAGLLTDPPRLAAMTTAAAQVGHRDAARQVAQAALDIALQAQSGRALDVRRAGGKP
jgi:UDP-N-acetylglucosamine--N-acetylmuramyl-(pentapeptide) pyrophosphoryl-undecaprenol N-acetylglucosamine transferase